MRRGERRRQGEWASRSLRRHGDEEPGKGLCRECGSPVWERPQQEVGTCVLFLSPVPPPSHLPRSSRLTVQMAAPDSASGPLANPQPQPDPLGATSSSMKWARPLLVQVGSTFMESLYRIHQSCSPGSGLESGVRPQDAEWKLLAEGPGPPTGQQEETLSGRGYPLDRFHREQGGGRAACVLCNSNMIVFPVVK